MAALLDVETAAPGEDEDEAYERLFRRWHPDVVALCRTLLGRMGDAEDAAQEALLRAWTARHQYSPTRPFWPWLATITRRLCVDQRRRLVRERTDRVVLDVDMMTQGSELVPERVIEVDEELRIVVRAIDGLRPTERRVFVRRELHGWSYRDIAVVEGLSVEAVRGSLKRARSSLRRAASETAPPTAV